MIIVFGAIHMDLVLPVESFPQSGEAALSLDVRLRAGGRGANQAIAANRIGPKTVLIGQVGDDELGERLVTGLRTKGIVTSAIGRSVRPSGFTIHMRDNHNEVRTVISKGANEEVTADQVPDEVLRKDTIILSQLDAPFAQILSLFERAKAKACTTILNIAPISDVPQDLLSNTDVLIMDDAGFKRIGVIPGKTCIVTKDADGCVAYLPDGEVLKVPALGVDVVDVSGAQDCYCGTFTGCLKEGMSLNQAMRMASVAAAISCTKQGTQASFPYLADIEKNLEKLSS